MSPTFQVLSRTESTATAVGASLLSVITVGAVLAMFASATPDVSTTQTIVLERVKITAAKSVKRCDSQASSRAGARGERQLQICCATVRALVPNFAASESGDSLGCLRRTVVDQSLVG